MLSLLPIGLFILLFYPFLYVIPSGDGNVEFLLANKVYDGSYFTNWFSYHPPLKLFITNFFFTFFGYWSYGYVGLVLGCIGIFAMYKIGEKLFDKNVGILSAILLALSGLYISVGLFSVGDFIMTVMILIAFAFYIHDHHFEYSTFASFAILTKETAVFFALSVLIVEIVHKRKNLLLFIIPVITLLLWLIFYALQGNEPWNDYNFSSTAEKGSIYTILHNLITFDFLNRYAYQNWLHLFVFNFNWVIWGLAFFSIKYWDTWKHRKEIQALALFIFLFSLCVLSFQTWTINRYVLPVLVFGYLFAAISLTKITYQKVFITTTILVSLISLSHSVDPISNRIWPKTEVLGEKIYHKNEIDGGDGVTYNMQYLQMMAQRTDMIKKSECSMHVLVAYNVDTLKLLDIHSCK